MTREVGTVNDTAKLESLAELWRTAAAAQKRAEGASRDAAIAAAKARDALLEFCIENGVTIKIEK